MTESVTISGVDKLGGETVALCHLRPTSPSSVSKRSVTLMSRKGTSSRSDTLWESLWYISHIGFRQRSWPSLGLSILKDWPSAMLRFELRGSDSNERIEVRSSANVFLRGKKGAITGRDMYRTSMTGSIAVQLPMLVYPWFSVSDSAHVPHAFHGTPCLQVTSANFTVAMTISRMIVMTTDLLARRHGSDYQRFKGLTVHLVGKCMLR